MAMREDTLTVTVTLKVPVGGLNVNDLEQRCFEAARWLFQSSVQRMQEEFQRREISRLKRREWRSRLLATRLGLVRLKMLKVRNCDMKQDLMLGDALLDLVPRQRMTRFVERYGLSLRARGLSYRQSAEALRDMGIDVSAMGLWRRVQARGRQRCLAEQHEQELLFEHKTLSQGEPPPYLYLESDEIHVRAQRSPVKSLRIKTGLSYTGRERKKGYSKPRYQLLDKRLYGGVESLEAFGKGWYTLLEQRHGISVAQAVLYLTDGDPGLVGLRATHFPQAIHAQDRAHVFRDITSGAPNEAAGKRWIGWLCSGEWERARRAMRQSIQRASGTPEILEKVLRISRKDFYGVRLFRRLFDPNRTQRMPYATGGVEKNQEITIGRAMKKRGMAWTARGAHHLSKLVFAFQNKDTWEALWKEPPP